MVTPPHDVQDDSLALLARLAVDPEQATAPRLYRALSMEERREAAEAFLANYDAARPWLVPRVAAAINFRRQTLEKWDDKRLAERSSSVPVAELAPRAMELLVAFHLVHRRELLTRFLDGIGVEHEDGQIRRNEDLTSVDADTVRASAEALYETHDPTAVLLYLLTFLSQAAHEPAGLRDWLEEVGRGQLGRTPSERRDPEDTGEAGAMTVLGAGSQFTTLDQQVVHVIVETAQGVEGALAEDALDDLIDELVHLNRSRQRSYFHAGFRDLLFDRPIPAIDRELNEGRAFWYWAGVITGLSRREAWAEIVELYDQEPVVRRLGQTGEGASYMAGPLVLRALCQTGRAADAGEFVTARGVVECRGMFQTAFHEASQLVREDRAAEARGLLDRLGAAVEIMEKEGTEPFRRIVLEVTRRRAHCFRQLGEFAKATQLLQRLEEDETDPDIQAMVIADLGLLEGGFRRLGELRIPNDEADIPDVRARLESGVDCYERAMAIDAPHSAHASYAMGVLDLLNEDFGRAAERLELAKSVFAMEPSRYGPSGVTGNADLCLGVALCRSLNAERMEYGAALIRGALEQGAELPPYMVTKVLESLSLSGRELVQTGAEAILKAAGAETLDAVLSAPGSLQSKVVVTSLLERARDDGRGQSSRAADYRRALRAMLRHGMVEEAEEALDYLEGAARVGIGRTEFLHLLDEPEAYEPAWEVDDSRWSRLMCLEAAGEYETAAGQLSEEFHRLLAEPTPFRLAEAASLIERIRSYGLQEDFVRPLKNRLEAIEHEDPDLMEVAADEQITVDVLFVGGNETQAKYDDIIKAELAETHPRINVTFMHPGWGSNWIRALEEAERRLENHDALVIMRYVRTHLGRQLRKRTPVPWWSCTGSGKDSIRRSIILAAGVAQGQMRERVESGAS